MTKLNWKDFKTKYMKEDGGAKVFKGSNLDFFNVFKQFLVDNGELKTSIEKTVNQESTVDEADIEIFSELTSFLSESADGTQLESTNGQVFDSWKQFLIEHGTPSDRYAEHLQECIEWNSPNGELKLELSFSEVDIDEYDPTEKDSVIEAKRKSSRNRNMSRGHLELIDTSNDEIIFSFSNDFMSRSEKDEERKRSVSIPKSSLEPNSIVNNKFGVYEWNSLCDNFKMMLEFSYPEQPTDESILSKKTYKNRVLLNQKLGKVSYIDTVNDRVIFSFDNADADKISQEHISKQKEVVTITGQDMMPKYTYDRAMSVNNELEKKNRDTSLSMG